MIAYFSRRLGEISLMGVDGFFATGSFLHRVLGAQGTVYTDADERSGLS